MPIIEEDNPIFRETAHVMRHKKFHCLRVLK